MGASYVCEISLLQEILGDLAGFWPLVLASGLGPYVMRDVSSMAPPTWNLAYDLVRWGIKHMDYLVRGDGGRGLPCGSRHSVALMTYAGWTIAFNMVALSEGMPCHLDLLSPVDRS